MIRLCLTGETTLLKRHALLQQSLEKRGFDMLVLDLGEKPASSSARYAVIAARFALRATASAAVAGTRTNPQQIRAAFYRSPDAFASKSHEFETKIGAQRVVPAAVLHLFGFSAPFATRTDVPYAHYLDDTLALRRRDDPTVGGSLPPSDAERFLELERRAYTAASRLFVTNAFVRDSIVDDYGVAAEKIDVVGAGPTIVVADMPKLFGTKRILFNASDFERRGGDLVMSAFALVRREDASAVLVTIGDALPGAYAERDGVEDRGRVETDELRELYTTSDVLLAPAAHGPLPDVALEAMAHGTPPIVRDRDGLGDLVRADVEGLVISDADATPEALAARLRALLADQPRLRALSDGARSAVATRLNWDAVAEKMDPFLRRPARS